MIGRPSLFDPRNSVTARPHLAAEATRKTWSMVEPCVTPEQAAEQAAALAEFFAAEVMRLEAIA